MSGLLSSHHRERSHPEEAGYLLLMAAHLTVREDLDLCCAGVAAGGLDYIKTKEAAGEGHRHNVRVNAVAGGEGPIPSTTVNDHGEGSRDRGAVRHLTGDESNACDLALPPQVDFDERSIAVAVRGPLGREVAVDCVCRPVGAAPL